MALPPAFLDELRARTPIAAVIGRRVRLARSGRQWKGCCPFHGEKTPSFYVYDDHYHCFGCGAHGDAITFVMQSQGAGFTEAVEQLAAEAGLDVPKPSPEAAEAERQRHTLHGVLDAAKTSYQHRLRLPEGRGALDYLHRRGLTDETIERFELGWSGAVRGVLLAELSREGITPQQLIEAGLMRQDDETGRSFELFSNRVMFPIRDRRGRTISFGGRILGEGQPKYLNGPESTLFSKRRNLYGLDLAREAVRGGAPLVVVEGYMDVIALAQSGFPAAVAPLGTALTEEQLEELWRLAPAPVLCFDGDAAGARAAARTAELALPMLAPDRTLRLAALPAGEDPDSITRRQGAAGFAAVLQAAQPLSDALYDLLRQGGGNATPEQRAAFRTRLEEAAKRIPDRALAGEYRSVLLDRFYADRRAPQRRTDRTSGPGGKRGVRPVLRGPRPLPAADKAAAERGRILTAILLRHARLLPEVEHAYAELDIPPVLAPLRDAIFGWADSTDVLDSGTLIDHLTKSGLQQEIEYTLATVPVPLPACASAAAMPAEAEAGWWHIYGFLNVDRLRLEVAAAQAAFAREMISENEFRLKALTEALRKVLAGEPDGADMVAA
jgi:DNA primase